MVEAVEGAAHPAPVTSGSRLGSTYWRVWWAGAIDSVGDGAWTAALPLLTISVTTDPRLVALVSAAAYLPWLLISLPAGVLVDRRPRLALMWRTQLVQLVAVGTVTVVVLAGAASVPLLAALVFALGCCEVVFGNAAQAVLPELVPRELLARANGNQYAGQITGEFFLGPPVGSLLFLVAAALPFGVDTVSFAVSAALLIGIRRHGEVGSRGPALPLRQAIGEGLRWLAGHRLLRTLAVLLGVNNFCNQLGQATLVLLATERLGVSHAGYGLLLSAGAAGSVLGGIVNPRVVRRIGRRSAVLTALTCSAGAYLAAGPVSDPAVLGALLAVNGFAVTLWNIVTVTLRQETVPPALLGRVTSVYRMLGWGLLPLGAIAGGLVAHGIGLRAPLPLAGALRGRPRAVARTRLPAAPPCADRAGGERLGVAHPTPPTTHLLSTRRRPCRRRWRQERTASGPVQRVPSGARAAPSGGHQLADAGPTRVGPRSAQPMRAPVAASKTCSVPGRTSSVSTSPMAGGTRPSKRTTNGLSSGASPAS
jgi:MFS family permease